MTIVNILYSGLGGHFSVVFSLIEADEQKEYNHVLIFYGIEDMPQSYVDKCGQKGVPFFLVKKKQGLDLASQKKVLDILKKINPSVILLHSISLILPVYGFILGKNTRIISVEHQSNHLKSKKEWLWSVLLMRLSANVVFLTELYASQMKKHLGFLYDPAKVRVISNGINTDLFKPIPAPNDNYSIGMLSRLISIKDHITLVEAFRMITGTRKYADIKLIIAGDGETKDRIMDKVMELNLSNSVDMPGMLSESISPEFLNKLTIYIHASFGETMSTAIMQAMACGKPVIASDVDGINNMVIHGETGILVPPGDKNALAAKIEELLSDRELRDRLGNNALQFARKNYSNKVMFARYRELFEKA